MSFFSYGVPKEIWFQLVKKILCELKKIVSLPVFNFSFKQVIFTDIPSLIWEIYRDILIHMNLEITVELIKFYLCSTAIKPRTMAVSYLSKYRYYYSKTINMGTAGTLKVKKKIIFICIFLS